MTTPQVAAELAKSQPHAAGPGPVQNDAEGTARSLRHKQRNLATMINGSPATTDTPPREIKEHSHHPGDVFMTGTQTLASLTAQIEHPLNKKDWLGAERRSSLRK